VPEDVFDRIIGVQILRLRRSWRAIGARQASFETERGVGYVFALRIEPL
jgi:two-component system OmpR family response regulator